MKQTNILISGVNSKNNVERILKHIDKSEIDPHFLELDYNAKNTIENVKHTIEYLRTHGVLNEVLIISHDYHILRIKAIFQDMMKDEDKFNIHYLSVNSNLSKVKDLKIIYKEVFKFFRTLAYLAIKDID